jgi:hypothetical protein
MNESEGRGMIQPLREIQNADNRRILASDLIRERVKWGKKLELKKLTP